MEKSKIITAKYVAVSRENIIDWLNENNFLVKAESISRGQLPKWAHFEIEDETL